MPDKPRYEWCIADAYLPPAGDAPPHGHEAICFLNTSPGDIDVSLDLFFEDRNPIKGLELRIRSERALHLRTDRFETILGVAIPREIPYAIRVRADYNLGVQYSRLDVTQPNYSLMTTVVTPQQ